MSKKRILTSLDKLTPELKKLVNMMYPEGYEDSLVKLENHKKEIIHVLSIETEDTIYLIKVNKGMKMALDMDDEDDDKTPSEIPDDAGFEGEEEEKDEEDDEEEEEDDEDDDEEEEDDEDED